MEKRILNTSNINGIQENADGSYSITTTIKKNFSKIITINSFIIALEGKEIVIYNNKLECIQKVDMYYGNAINTQKYNCGKVQFLVVDNRELLIFENDNFTWTEIPLEVDEVGHATYRKWKLGKGIISPDKKTFFLDVLYRVPITSMYEIVYDIIFKINLKEKSLQKVMIIEHSDDCININKDSRFITVKSRRHELVDVYDLYTGHCYVLPYEYHKDVFPDEIKVMYSSKEIISIRYINSSICYLYINGERIYQYDVEENKQIIEKLKNKMVRGEFFSTIIVEDLMIIWTEKQRPEVRIIY